MTKWKERGGECIIRSFIIYIGLLFTNYYLGAKNKDEERAERVTFTIDMRNE
jgi:hypothetical protein